MTFGSLFSGAGGLDLGFERAGMKCKWQIEINPFCQQVLTKHWPEVPKYGDIKEVEQLESVDVFAGGFPCKNTSTASAVHGRRSGLSGPESGLWYEYVRLIAIYKPSWVVVENVAGVEAWSSQITGCLEGFEYVVSRVDISACDVGAPHLRRRVFFVANRHGKRLAQSGSSESCQAAVDKRRAADRDSWFQALAGVLRVDDGVPGGIYRRDRITAIGNAVAPPVAERIGRMIMECR